MSRFYGEMRGTRDNAVTRCGDAKKGMTAHIRGWNAGVKIYCYVDADGKDIIEVYRTGGSRNDANLKRIATIKEGE